MRSLREEPCVKDAVDAACLRWHRADDAWQHATWVVLRDPHAGAPVNEGGTLRVMESFGARSNDLPTVWLAYTFSPTLVAVYDVKFSDAVYAQAGRA